MPPGACDCHVHVFDPDRFPYAPSGATRRGLLRSTTFLPSESRIGISRYVVVQPSVYGIDNACLVAALHRLGDRARGVAVIDPERTLDSELDALHRAGVRSVRVNLETQGERDPAAAGSALEAAARRIAGRGWSVQVFAGLPLLAGLADRIASLPVPLVADHFGGARGEGGAQQPGLAPLIELLKSGKAYVKLSAPYRSSRREPGYDDLAEIARAFITAAPQQLVWASDWPHTGGGRTGASDRSGRSLSEIEPFRKIDVQRTLALLAEWSGDPQTWRRILVDNPTRLYGFA